MINLLLALSLFLNFYLLYKYGKLLIERRKRLEQLTAVSELLARSIIKQAIKPSHERLETLNENREN